jgi:predicted porin
MFRLTTRSMLVMVPFITLSYVVNANNFMIYGQGHLSADSVDDGEVSSEFVTSSSSRLGFNGDYQITDKLKVIFQYETGVDLTAQGGNDGNGGAESSGQIFTKGRPSYVGLSGEFGKILIGHMPALDQWANDYNLFADQVGDLGNLWEGSGIPGRLDNVIYYESPDINGASVAVTYVPEEGKDNTDNLIVKGNYHISGLKIGAVFASIGQGTASLDDHTALALTIGYDFGRFSLGGGIQHESDIRGLAGDDRSSYSLGGSAKLGDKGTIKSQFAVSSGEGENSDARQFAIGYDYALDEDTTLYIAYARTSNDSNVNFSSNGKGHGDKIVPAFGNDPSAISLGIVAKFDLSFPL